jgi:hypothetical protein
MFLRSSAERRAAARVPVNLRGVLVAPGVEMICLIRDQSEGGFRLRMDRALSLPRQVVLVDIAAGTACEAEVAWSKGVEAGLRCTGRSLSLRGLVPARLTPARDAWLRAGGR